MTRIVACMALLIAPAARADLIAHALVRYGGATLTIDEHFGSPTAAASLLYNTPGLFHGTAEATAAYGRADVSATVLAVGAAYPVNASFAEAAFSDTLTISGPSGTGFVVYTYSTDGWTTGGLSQGALFLRHGADPDEELDDEIVGPEEFSSLPHAIVFGQPFTTGIVMQCHSAIGMGETGEFGAVLSATLTGLAVFDGGMNPIGQFTVTSLSGTQYPLPEPSGVFIVAAGMMFGRRRRPARRGDGGGSDAGPESDRDVALIALRPATVAELVHRAGTRSGREATRPRRGLWLVMIEG
jgi:hypothetical protein